MSVDNTDMAVRDLEKAIDQMPPTAIHQVLTKWQCRIDWLRTSLEFVRKSTKDPKCPVAREIQVLEQAKKEIEAACAVEKGDAQRAFRIMLEDETTNTH